MDVLLKTRTVLSRLDPVQRPSPGNPNQKGQVIREEIGIIQVKSDTIVLWVGTNLYYNI
jgi:hypothetical protein